MKKNTEEDTNKWKHILCSWIERNNIIKHHFGFVYNTQSNLYIQFNSYQDTNMFFIELEQVIPKFIWNHNKNLEYPQKS